MMGPFIFMRLLTIVFTCLYNSLCVILMETYCLQSLQIGKPQFLLFELLNGEGFSIAGSIRGRDWVYWTCLEICSSTKYSLVKANQFISFYLFIFMRWVRSLLFRVCVMNCHAYGWTCWHSSSFSCFHFQYTRNMPISDRDFFPFRRSEV